MQACFNPHTKPVTPRLLGPTTSGMAAHIMKSRQLIVVVLAVATLMGGLVATSPGAWEQMRDTSAQTNRSEPIQRVASVDALRPQTASERARAERFNSSGKKLQPSERRYSISEVGPSVDLLGVEVMLERPDGSVVKSSSIPSSTPTPAQQLARRVCESDAVVVGRPESRRAIFNKNETGLFTDYTVTVIESIRPATQTTTVTITHIGGVVDVAGQVMQDLQSEQRLRLRSVYALFLKDDLILRQAGVFQILASPVLIGAATATALDSEFTKDLQNAAKSC